MFSYSKTHKNNQYWQFKCIFIINKNISMIYLFLKRIGNIQEKYELKKAECFNVKIIY